ncbi:MAG: T9SS C-terminal target domain-containing protein [Ignavibacteriae bacterium]|nr:MAG: T9SS C-terminal target domain-containing protein [Ignavibacteriota bacterium]
MKKIELFILLFFLFSNTILKSNIVYLDPKPGSEYVNIENTITIGFDKQVTLTKDIILKCIRVEGSKSSLHKGQIILCSNNSKIIFKPFKSFDYGEKVVVNITGELLKYISNNKHDFSCSFNTSKQKIEINPFASNEIDSYSQMNSILITPPFNVTVNSNPSDGYLFLTPYNGKSYLIISDKNGIPLWSAILQSFSGDFKKQSGNNFSYFDGALKKHFELDYNFIKTDSFYCGNGYTTDIHELRVLSNGYALLMAYDTQVVDMSKIITGGDTAALVFGTIIQEVDDNNNVVFQWRSWDHFEITDALHENLLAHKIDAVHGNSIDVDTDNNLILSSRHLDEVTKINRTTGDIIWRFGGLNNQFTYLNDSIPFHYQHAARRISNGNITIYDNGNFHTPHYSRAAEYHLDEVNKTAELVWQYIHTPIIYGFWGGFVQRLPGGNTLISWGGTNPTITEVTPSGNIAFEGSYPSGVYTYRAYKFQIENFPIAVNGNQTGLPESFSLEQNYPNPFNPVTKINFNIASSSFVELTVFDILGREVRKLVSENKSAGRYSVIFDGNQISSGIYIYKFTAGNYSETRKMILLK